MEDKRIDIGDNEGARDTEEIGDTELARDTNENCPVDAKGTGDSR